MSDDDRAFIRTILSNPNDEGPRLVYADWLDEHDDPRGTFLRTEVALAALPAGDARAAELQTRLRLLEPVIDANWIALVDRPQVENCSGLMRFQFECPQQWEAMKPTGEASVRHCEVCKKRVYFCRNLYEAGQHARLGDCVAISTLTPRFDGDLEEQIDFHRDRFVTAGVPAIPEVEPEEEKPRRRRWWQWR